MSEQSDVFDFFTLLSNLIKAWKTIAVFVLIGLCLGIFAAITLPKYRSEAIIEIAQIGLEKAALHKDELETSLPLEPVESVLVRTKNSYFINKVIQRLLADDIIEEKQISSWRSKLARLPRKNKDTNLINLTVYTKTDSQGKEIITRFVETLAQEQEDTYQKRVQQLQGKIQDLEEQQHNLEKQYAETHQKIATNHNNVINYMSLSHLNSERMIIEIKQLIIANKQALMEPNTHQSRLLSDVYVSDRPVEPKESVLLLLGVIGGGIIGSLYVLFTISYRKFRQSKLNINS